MPNQSVDSDIVALVPVSHQMKNEMTEGRAPDGEVRDVDKKSHHIPNRHSHAISPSLLLWPLSLSVVDRNSAQSVSHAGLFTRYEWIIGFLLGNP